MPKTVKESRLKVSIGVAIATLIFCLIPIIIIAFVSINHPDVWSAPYPQFAIYFLIISMYFALIIGFAAPLHKIVWLVLHVITGLATFGLLIAAYIVQNALLIHLASSMLFMFMIYFVSRDSSDNIYLRYSCPLFCLIAALISVLLFMGINLTMVAQNIISAVFNGVYLIILICSFCKFISSNELRSVTEKQLSYSQETEEEIAERKEKRALEKAKVVRNADGTIDTSRWRVSSSDINRIWDTILHQYNRIIRLINDDIRFNNASLNSNYSRDYEVKQASKSNKDIGKCVKFFKHKLKVIEKNLKKINEKTFTANDKYKSFEYHVLSGKLKSKPSLEEHPTLYLVDFRCYYNYDASVVGTCLAEITFDGEELYLFKI